MSEDTLVAFNTEALKLSIMGVTIVVATGDNGAAANANYCNLRSGSFDYGFWDVSHKFLPHLFSVTLHVDLYFSIFFII